MTFCRYKVLRILGGYAGVCIGVYIYIHGTIRLYRDDLKEHANYFCWVMGSWIRILGLGCRFSPVRATKVMTTLRMDGFLHVFGLLCFVLIQPHLTTCSFVATCKMKFR